MEWKLSPGDRGPAVRVMQALLNMHGGLASPVPENGVFDAATVAAMVTFKRSRHLGTDGSYDEQTRVALVGRSLPLEAKAGPAAPWMDIAMAEEAANIQENPSRQHHHPRILEYHAQTKGRAVTDEDAWCSSFANWVLAKAGYSVDRNARAYSWKHWGKSVRDGQFGAVTLLYHSGGYHVGFAIEKRGHSITLLGGNQGDDGKGRVKRSNFPLGMYKIEASCWPEIHDEPKSQ